MKVAHHVEEWPRLPTSGGKSTGCGLMAFGFEFAVHCGNKDKVEKPRFWQQDMSQTGYTVTPARHLG